jgi:GrpB-like predicted nucleotidyltransferase (UPF0157 family)
MLTPEQETWLVHLPDQDQVTIHPFDPTAQQKFEAVKLKLQAVLGMNARVEHHGATRLGISGQDEIDVYVPVPEQQFMACLAPLTAAFGQPRSHYPLERARFVTYEDGKHVDIFLINATCHGWLDGLKFMAYLTTHPDVLDAYQLLKETGHGLSTRAYYRRKLEFFNEVLSLADQAMPPTG